MRSVDVGCGSHPAPGTTWGMDAYRTSATALLGDALALPFKDGSLDRLTARHVVEHLPTNGHAGRDPFFAFFDEAWRVLKPGGVLHVEVPHAQGPSAYGDPTHRRFLMPAAFAHLWDPSKDPGYPRRPWALLDLYVTRFYDTSSHLDERHPYLDWALRRWAERFGPPDAIVVELEPASAGVHDGGRP
jgi:SAM-dependent methyltransferase